MAIPKYAEGVPRDQMVKFLCKRKCNNSRYGRVSRTPWEDTGAVRDPSLYVTCLKCGGTQEDCYNWQRL